MDGSDNKGEGSYISRIRIAVLIRAITARLVKMPEGVSVDAALRSLNQGLRDGHELVSELAASGDPVGSALLRIPFLQAHDNLVYEPLGGSALGAGAEAGAGAGAEAGAEAEDEADEEYEEYEEDGDEQQEPGDEEDGRVDDEDYGDVQEAVEKVAASVDSVASMLSSTFSISLAVGVVSLLCVATSVLGMWRDVRLLLDMNRGLCPL